MMAATAGSLFDADVPEGFIYRDDFISPETEARLVDEIGRVEFSTFEMHGAVARRRVALFGMSYDAIAAVAPPMPAFLIALRASIAEWAGVEPETFAMALINEYRPGTPIGWHRDAPQYDLVAGVSLLSPCRLKFRRYQRPLAREAAAPGPRFASHEIRLEPRSAYLMTGASRSAYEHHIPAVAALRYSITFRTLRPRQPRPQEPETHPASGSRRIAMERNTPTFDRDQPDNPGQRGHHENDPARSLDEGEPHPSPIEHTGDDGVRRGTTPAPARRKGRRKGEASPRPDPTVPPGRTRDPKPDTR